MTEPTTERGQLEFGTIGDHCITFTRMPEGSVTVEIEEEQAVSSYNAQIQCDFTMNKSQLATFILWLLHLPTPEMKP